MARSLPKLLPTMASSAGTPVPRHPRWTLTSSAPYAPRRNPSLPPHTVFGPGRLQPEARQQAPLPQQRMPSPFPQPKIFVLLLR